MSLGQLVLELKLDGNNFTVNLKSAEGALAQFVAGTQRANTAVKRAEAAHRSWGTVIRDSIVGLALVKDAVRTLSDVTFGWQAAIIATNSEMEKSIMLMKNFSRQTDPMKATGEAVGDVNKLLARASTSPFNLTQVTDAFVKLRVGGVEPVFKSLDTLIDSVSAFGGSGEALKRAGVAIQQMAGKGVVSMEELRQQLGEAVPTAINAMAAGLGTTYSKLVKEISQGKVLSKPAILAMMQQLELQFKGSAQAMMDTWGGAVAQFETDTKKLAVAFGGLGKDGYEQDGYLKTVTHELQGLNDVLSSPEMINSARELGKSIAGMITTVASGTKWIIENRDEIITWTKYLLILWATWKGASIISSVATTAGAAIQTLSMKMIQMRMQGQSVTGAMGGLVSSMSGWNSAAAIAAGGATRIATGSTLAGGAVRMLGGAIGIVAGPIGLAATLAISLGMAYYESKKGAEAAREAILGLNGALTDNNQLMQLDEARKSKKADYEDKYGDSNNQFQGYMTKEQKAEYETGKAAAQAELAKIDKDFLTARLNVADSYAEMAAQKLVSKAGAKIADLSKAYSIDLSDITKQFEDEAKKSGKKFDEKGYAGAIKQRMNIKFTDEIESYTTARDEAQKAQDELVNSAQKSAKGNPILSQEDLVRFETGKKVLSELNVKIADTKVAMSEYGRADLASTIVGGKDGKVKAAPFDMLTIFVDGLRKSVATLGAKAEETNPYLAQLQATVESLGGVHLPSFDKTLADGKKFAEQKWAQEKANKAVTDSNKSYADTMERIQQIQEVMTAKNAKAEEKNPWMKASADAVRYEEELQDLLDTSEKARQKAVDAQNGTLGDGLLDELKSKALLAEKAADDLRAKIDLVKTAAASKQMGEDAFDITNSLKSQTEQLRGEYDKKMALADDYYARNKGLMDKDSEAYANYELYKQSLTAQFNRENETGLESWIRANKDATDQYKSLWGSAMDKFSDTITDGLLSGKMEFSSFVEYILKEFLRIQIAKSLATAAEAASGSSGILGTLFSVGTSLLGASSGGGNGMAAGSAGATSSNLGASQAGYSSQYFADGGIMTEYGKLALKKYAKGGVAKTPQVAIYGEGSGAEAYVPLPDGRSIPVTMSGGTNTGGSGMKAGDIPVTVNIYSQGGEQQQAESSSKFDGEQLVIDVIVKNASKPGPVRDAIKNAAA